MNGINEGRVGRNKGLRAFHTETFRIAIIVGLVFLLVIAQICRDIELNISVVMDLAATLNETGDDALCCKIECHVVTGIYLVAVDQFERVVANDRTGGVRSCILWRRVCDDLVLQARRGHFDALFALVGIQPNLVLHFPIRPFVLLATAQK